MCSGGYESGEIKVWAINIHSLLNMQKVLRLSSAVSHASTTRRVAITSSDMEVREVDSATSSGLSMSPLLLLSEWVAHHSPILACESDRN